MSVPISTLIQSTVITITFFLCLLSFSFWYTQREESSMLWLSLWLGLGTIFAFLRLLQYIHINEQWDIIVPRALFTTTYTVVWVGYKLGNSLAKYRPPIWERILISLLILIPIIGLWSSDLIMTREVIYRSVALGGTFHGTIPGPLYLVISIIMVGIGFIPPIRLLRKQSAEAYENRLMAAGFLIVIGFAIFDFSTVFFNLTWIRLSDFSYLPLGIFFGFIQIRRFSNVYRNMDGLVKERTRELEKVNRSLSREIQRQKKTDETRQQAVSRYHSLFEQTHDAVFIIDPQGRILEANKRAGEMVGFSSQDLPGHLYSEFAENVQLSNENLKRLLNGEKIPPYERVFLRKDGAQVPVEIIGELVCDAHGKPLHIQKVVRDITERKKTEKEKQQKTNELFALAEVNRQISSSLQLQVVLERISEFAKDLLNAETSAVYLAEPSSQTLKAVSAMGVDEKDIRKDSLKIGEGILGNIALQKSGEIVSDTSRDPRGIIIEGTKKVAEEHLMGVPVLSDNKLAGLIAVWRTGEGQDFTSADLDFLTNMAGQVSVAIKNARLFDETQTRLREMEGMAQVSETLSHSLDLEPQLYNILQAVIDAIPNAERGTFLLADQEDNLHIRATYGYKDPRVRDFIFPSDRGYASRVFHERQPILIENARGSDVIRYDGDIPEIRSILSAIAAPLIVKDRPIGVISIDSSLQEDAFTKDDLHLLTAISGSAAISVENASLFENTRQRLSVIEGVNIISSSLRSAQSLQEALPIILDQLMNLLNVKGATLELIDARTGEIVSELARGAWAPVTGIRTPGGMGITGHVVKTGEPYITKDVVADGKSFSAAEGFKGLVAVAVVPIISQHQPIGALWVGRETPIQPEEVSLLTAIGEMVGNAIHRMMLFEQSQQLIRDLQVSHQDLFQAYESTLEGWVKALELRDKDTEGHSRRITDLTQRLARHMGVGDEDLVQIKRGTLLHDIGKLGISDQILRKTGPLDAREWVEMRKHPQYAFDWLYPITYLRPALDIPYCHHEKWDGTGYPRGLKGKHIPLAARIFAIVDVYDALAFGRPYHAPWPRQSVLEYLMEQSGTHFDPQVVKAFFEIIPEEEKV